MKKIFFAIAAFFFAFTAQAQELTEGKQYQVLNLERSSEPEVIEFFSFYCPHCYSFEMEYKIPQKIKEGLPEHATFKQYHVNFMGRQSENLTRAWALAMALGAEEKVKKALFDAAQADKLSSMDDIRQKFIDSGVSAEQFDNGINSFLVNSLVNKQVNAAKHFEVRGVPDFYVNGKFRVNPEGLSREDFINDYVNTVKGLMQR